MTKSPQKMLPGILACLLTSTAALLCLIGLTSSAGAQGARSAAENPLGSVLAQSEAVVSIDPPSAEVDAGDSVTMTVRVTDVIDLHVAVLYISFDSDLLEVVDADPDGQSGAQIEPGDFLSPGSIEENYVYYDGAEEIAFVQKADEPASGYGLLATIVFRGKAAGESDIDFYNDSSLEDEDNLPISADFQGASIVVIAEETPTPTPETATPTPATATPTPEADTPTPGTDTPEPTPSDTPPPTQTSTPGPTSAPPTAPPQPTATVGVIESRVLQTWPDRSVGVISELLEDTSAHADTQVLPFGVLSASSGEVVRARTYLHFPLNVFPQGADVLKATLFVYVDSSSGAGEAELGVYRALAPWDEESWSGDPTTWPALLDSPIAVTAAHLDATGSELPIFVVSSRMLPQPSRPAGHGLLKPSGTAAIVGQILGREDAEPPVGLSLAFTSPPSPLLTPTPDPTQTPNPTRTPSPTQTRTPTPAQTAPPPSTTATATGAPAPTPIPAASISTVRLEEMEGTWLEWDVTALVRAWLAGEVEDHGLALAPAPNPDADPEVAGDLILARLLATEDPETRPYIVADIEIHPVTPTPTPMPILPSAGGSAGWSVAGILLIGAALLALGLVMRRRG